MMTAELQSFDFIGDEVLRISLQGDLAELQIAVEHGAHKAVVVLAGSIIEALLLDHLVSTDHQQRTGGDPLRYDFHKLIEVCSTEGVIRESTAHLLRVVKDYRNLIHPGRSLRTKEKVHRATAAIASNVVTLISSEMAVRPNRQFGMTAEQILAKVRHDPQSVLMRDHLLSDVREPQLSKLLLKTVPAALQDDAEVEPRRALSVLYRQCFSKAPDELKQQAIFELCEVIKTGSGEKVHNALYWMFAGWHLAYAASEQQSLILDRILVETRPSGKTLSTNAYFNILNPLQPPQALNFARRLHERVLNWEDNDRMAISAILLGRPVGPMGTLTIAETRAQFDTTLATFKKRKATTASYNSALADWYQQIIDSVDDDIPF